MSFTVRKQTALPMLALSSALMLTFGFLPQAALSKNSAARRTQIAQANPSAQNVKTTASSGNAKLAQAPDGAHPQPAANVRDKEVDLPAVDGAMLSVLKDIVKAARDPAQSDKLTDPVQKAALKSALDAMDAAVSNSQTQANRIIEAQKDKNSKSLTAESWQSGLLELPNSGQASLSILWAKKIDGFINIAVAGNCDCKGATPDAHIGEYAVVLTGKTSLDHGFDIQSQTDVNFWLGSLTNLSADATKCGDGQVASGTRVPVLNAVVTADGVRRQQAAAKREKIAQLKVEQDRARTAQALASQPATADSPQGTQQAENNGQAPAPTPGLLYAPELKPAMPVPEHQPAVPAPQ